MTKNHFFERNISQFKKNPLAKYSLLIFSTVSFFCLFSELLCNNRPLIMCYRSELYFPIFKFYPAVTFFQENSAETDYKELAKNTTFIKEKNWMIFPLIPFDVNESVSNLSAPPPSPPTRNNLLGTDDRGRDLLTRLTYGFRNSFLFATVSWLFISFFAYLFGALQGYFGGKVDFFGQRFTEVWSALPILYVVIFLLSIFPSSLLLLTLIWVSFGWIGLSSYLRVEVLRIRKADYITAATALGMGRTRVLLRHILPNALTPMITFSPFIFSASIGSLAALDYLGLGLPIPSASWGELLRQGKENLSSWWLVFFPVFSLFLTLLLLNFIGEGIREAFDSHG